MADWIGGNYYLNLSQMQTNASYIYSKMGAQGWTINAISGMLGNMQSESTINPGIWQKLIAGNLKGGFGLVQWTPASKYIDWAESEGLTYTDMDSNIARINWELENRQQFYPTEQYPMTFAEFKVSTESPYILGAVFLYNYERPASPKPDQRGKQAEYWYEYLSGEEPPTPKPPPYTGSKSKIWLSMKRKERKRWQF